MPVRALCALWLVQSIVCASGPLPLVVFALVSMSIGFLSSSSFPWTPLPLRQLPHRRKPPHALVRIVKVWIRSSPSSSSLRPLGLLCPVRASTAPPRRLTPSSCACTRVRGDDSSAAPVPPNGIGRIHLLNHRRTAQVPQFLLTSQWYPC